MVEEKWVNFWHNTKAWWVMVPLIVGVHWAWFRVRDNPYLVPVEERRDIANAFRKVGVLAKEKVFGPPASPGQE